MKVSRSPIMISILCVIVGISALYIIFPESISAQQKEDVFVTHTGSVIKTAGEIIDPVYTTSIDPEHTTSTIEFDPMEYLREFNYGQVSQLPDGTTLREFTIIAEDDQIMEVSPGVFFNVWTYNGDVDNVSY